MKKTLLMMAALVPLVCTSTGCVPWWFFDDDDGEVPPPPDDTPPPVEPPVQNLAPNIDVDLADWPPPGAGSKITIILTDDFGLDSMDVSFRNELTFFPFGLSDEVEVLADDLGEGLGNLNISVLDIDGARQESFVSDLLIDLTPPEITLGETVVRHAADSDIELWVADAWILGHVELKVGETTVLYDFEDGYPSTLGESWDYSLVQFASTEFVEGTDDAVVTLYDAAGNVTQADFEITLDGQPPLVTITSPAPATVVTGLFDVALNATDTGGGPVWIELRVEGTPVATAVGPTATVQLDATELTPGAVDLEAVATDQAGNVSLLATVPIIVQ